MAILIHKERLALLETQIDKLLMKINKFKNKQD